MNHQSKGLESHMPVHAMKRAAIVTQKNVPIRAIVIDAVDKRSKEFYRSFGFEPRPIDGFHQWLVLKD